MLDYVHHTYVILSFFRPIEPAQSVERMHQRGLANRIEELLYRSAIETKSQYWWARSLSIGRRRRNTSMQSFSSCFYRVSVLYAQLILPRLDGRLFCRFCTKHKECVNFWYQVEMVSIYLNIVVYKKSDRVYI